MQWFQNETLNMVRIYRILICENMSCVSSWLILLPHDFLPAWTKIVYILNFECFVLTAWISFLFLSDSPKQWGGASVRPSCLNSFLSRPPRPEWTRCSQLQPACRTVMVKSLCIKMKKINIFFLQMKKKKNSLIE